MNSKLLRSQLSIKIIFSMVPLLLGACQSNEVQVAEIFNNTMCHKPKVGISQIDFHELASLRGSRLISLNKSSEQLADKTSQETQDREDAGELFSIYLGAQPSGGYSIALERVDRTMDQFEIFVRLLTPDPNSMVTQSITYPCMVIELNNLPTTAQLNLFVDGQEFAGKQSLPAL